jgi:hypothetical protein
MDVVNKINTFANLNEFMITVKKEEVDSTAINNLRGSENIVFHPEY